MREIITMMSVKEKKNHNKYSVLTEVDFILILLPAVGERAEMTSNT